VVGSPGNDLPPAGPWTDAPPLTDADLPPDQVWRDMPWPIPEGCADWDPDRGDPLDHEFFASFGILWPWPTAPITIRSDLGALGQAGAGRAPPGPASSSRGAPGLTARRQAEQGRGGAGGPPPGGLIDITLPWATLTGQASAPGTLGRIGPVTAPQARQLARMGTINHATVWRIVLTDPAGTAVAAARVPRARSSARPGPGGPAGQPPTAGTTRAASAPTIGRVTVIVPVASLDRAERGGESTASAELAWISRRIAAAGRRARDAAREQAEADGHAPGGCAHSTASAAYRPPPRLREAVIARDQTCRNPRCGQPAWRADLDHTRPYHLGGLTCGCNLGGFCRADHQLKQLPRWTLTQPRPGVFVWVTPAGRAYTARPDQHHAG
jgi:hypothetical protein